MLVEDFIYFFCYTFNMHLRRIDINGFKSFGERTVLEFAPGVTCIVGPNGSGKSNVVDAIRWVLGEQGYKGIRLEKSDDVIFLGSKGKGKMSRASVEMMLADIPAEKSLGYEELIVSRHVYRDGEGEYFMNRAHVRLKDTLEILAQLHVSTKNYSIVTQGMSDQLLRFTPQELRSTLEDASGVKEWQLKKRDAQRKLVRSGEHTGQVQALLAELKPYLANLRGQMRRWEKRAEYEKKVQELKELKIYVSVRDLMSRKKASQAQRERLRMLIERLETQKKTLSIEVAEMEKRVTAHGVQASGDSAQTDTTALEKLYQRRMQLEREFIRVESQLASFTSARPQSTPDVSRVRGGISRIRVLLEALTQEVSPDVLYAGIRQALEAVGALEKSFDAPTNSVPKEIINAQQKLKDAIRELERDMDEVKRQDRQARTQEQQVKEELFQKERTLRRVEDELERALREEASLMEGAGMLAREEHECVSEASRAIPDTPSTPEELLRVLETSYAGKSTLPRERIEEELIRANVYLSEIGDVDPQVKAEHDKVEERFAFLSKELEDVRGASADLGKLIKDLEEEIKKKFEESFVNVNKEFSRYMETIFGGGKGELLKLAPPKKKREEDDDYGHDNDDEEEREQEKEGIAVRVELPGKRIKSLELLSGGERALTSLAFLFALIASARPPFVVLDEVDAALDEANSKRFANLLESVKTQTQCIVVTHNRSTMHVAAALYGVTMGGDGISRILSLKLEK